MTFSPTAFDRWLSTDSSREPSTRCTECDRCEFVNDAGHCATCAEDIANENAAAEAAGFPMGDDAVATPAVMRAALAVCAERGKAFPCEYPADRKGPCGACPACDEARHTAAGIVFARNYRTAEERAVEFPADAAADLNAHADALRASLLADMDAVANDFEPVPPSPAAPARVRPSAIIEGWAQFVLRAS